MRPSPPARSASSWLTRSTAPEASQRLFCFPHGGGSAAEYARWGRGLAALDVRAVQLPGRGARWAEPALSRMHALATAIAENAAFEPPYAFFGHSLGAIVAYEVTRALQTRDLPLAERLFVSGHAAPSLPRRLPAIHELPDEPFLAEIERRHGGVPPEAHDDPSLRAALIASLRADYEIVETYVPEPRDPLPVAISVMAGSEDLLTDADLEAWQAHTAFPLAVRRFPGGHFYLREQGKAVRRTIARAMRA